MAKSIDPESREAIHHLLLQGGNVKAVDFVRQKMGLGLRDAKEIVDEIFNADDYRMHLREQRRASMKKASQ